MEDGNNTIYTSNFVEQRKEGHNLAAYFDVHKPCKRSHIPRPRGLGQPKVRLWHANRASQHACAKRGVDATDERLRRMTKPRAPHATTPTKKKSRHARSGTGSDEREGVSQREKNAIGIQLCLQWHLQVPVIVTIIEGLLPCHLQGKCVDARTVILPVDSCVFAWST